jgi:hypothetical protein
MKSFKQFIKEEFPKGMPKTDKGYQKFSQEWERDFPEPDVTVYKTVQGDDGPEYNVWVSFDLSDKAFKAEKPIEAFSKILGVKPVYVDNDEVYYMVKDINQFSKGLSKVQEKFKSYMWNSNYGQEGYDSSDVEPNPYRPRG